MSDHAPADAHPHVTIGRAVSAGAALVDPAPDPPPAPDPRGQAPPAPPAPSVAAVAADDHRGTSTAVVVKRLAYLAVTGVTIYVLLPGLVQVFGSFADLQSINLWWFVPMIAAEVGSFAFVTFFTRLLLPQAGWFGITCAQMSGHVASTVVPGGAATGGAVQYRMLVRADADPAAVGSAMTVQGIILTGAVFALPVFVLPVVLLGAPVPGGLLQTALIGFGLFVVLCGFGALVMVSDRVVTLVARSMSWAARVLHRTAMPPLDLAAHLIAERNTVRRHLGRRWWLAVVFSVGKWALEYLALLLALAAVGAHPRPSLVLLAYTASAVLSMIPITPGGLGFVEAGLTATLALAAVAAAPAALATLAYRLVSYWLPLPVGLALWMIHRRRSGDAPTREDPVGLAPVAAD